LTDENRQGPRGEGGSGFEVYQPERGLRLAPNEVTIGSRPLSRRFGTLPR
jgi:hypothetical protein